MADKDNRTPAQKRYDEVLAERNAALDIDEGPAPKKSTPKKSTPKKSTAKKSSSSSSDSGSDSGSDSTNG